MQRKEDIREKIASGIFWKLLENGGDQLITFVISIVLARLLGPEKYGTMSLMLIFVAIANVLIQTGFQTALIQKKEIDEADCSSVFWCGLLIAAALYVLLFALAPFCADFFADAQIEPMLRVLSLILFFGSVTSLEIAVIARRMAFRKQCLATVAADLLSGAAGIALAYRGAGTWALVFQQLLKNVFLAAILFILVGWRPQRIFSFSRLSVLFGYGWKVLLSGLIDTIWTNLYTPVISKLYNPLMTGYYSRGNQFPQVIANAAAQSMQAVMLPAYSQTQDDTERLRAMLRRTIQVGCFLMFPAMFGLAAVADRLVFVLLGSDWRGAAPYLALCSIGYSVWPMHVANLQAINAVGRSDLYLKLEVIKKIMGLAVLLLSVRYGIFSMILFKSLTDFVCTWINAWPNRRLVGYGPAAQWKDVGKEFLAAAAMGLAVAMLPQAIEGFLPSGMPMPETVVLAVQVLAGAALYMGAAVLLRFESLHYLMR